MKALFSERSYTKRRHPALPHLFLQKRSSLPKSLSHAWADKHSDLTALGRVTVMAVAVELHYDFLIRDYRFAEIERSERTTCRERADTALLIHVILL